MQDFIGPATGLLQPAAAAWEPYPIADIEWPGGSDVPPGLQTRMGVL
jgi:hypothetical protein